MKIQKIIYWVSTLFVCGVFLFSATMYFTKYSMVEGFFKALNHPTYLIYPLASLKIIGVIVILLRKNNWLTEWAYAGFFFNAILASAAHFNANHDIGLSYFVIPFILVSYFLGKKVRGNVINN
ncbi:DoxX-like protein [Lacinutrix venerupis]|uniref:DoxX family protein n=1 Tax=Lacinutrix venerupis TaxID=1486034 RepID=UPI000EB50694|nr:DoxX family protein [Lacinutrix venerupis]RLJ63390.1 DoxX-like protein [Lacinutrix venerupis]